MPKPVPIVIDVTEETSIYIYMTIYKNVTIFREYILHHYKTIVGHDYKNY